MGREKVNTRRRFIKNTTAVGIGISIAPQLIAKSNTMENNAIVISTWRHGVAANKVAWEILKNNGRALDAAEKGVQIFRVHDVAATRQALSVAKAIR